MAENQLLKDMVTVESAKIIEDQLWNKTPLKQGTILYQPTTMRHTSLDSPDLIDEWWYMSKEEAALAGKVVFELSVFYVVAVTVVNDIDIFEPKKDAVDGLCMRAISILKDRGIDPHEAAYAVPEFLCQWAFTLEAKAFQFDFRSDEKDPEFHRIRIGSIESLSFYNCQEITSDNVDEFEDEEDAPPVDDPANWGYTEEEVKAVQDMMVSNPSRIERFDGIPFIGCPCGRDHWSYSHLDECDVFQCMNCKSWVHRQCTPFKDSAEYITASVTWRCDGCKDSGNSKRECETSGDDDNVNKRPCT